MNNDYESKEYTDMKAQKMAIVQKQSERRSICSRCAKNRGGYCETNSDSVAKIVTQEKSLRECFKMRKIN